MSYRSSFEGFSNNGLNENSDKNFNDSKIMDSYGNLNSSSDLIKDNKMDRNSPSFTLKIPTYQTQVFYLILSGFYIF